MFVDFTNIWENNNLSPFIMNTIYLLVVGGFGGAMNTSIMLEFPVMAELKFDLLFRGSFDI